MRKWKQFFLKQKASVKNSDGQNRISYIHDFFYDYNFHISWSAATVLPTSVSFFDKPARKGRSRALVEHDYFILIFFLIS